VKSQYMLIASVVVGGFLALQGVINAHLGKVLQHPLHASFISFLVGVITISFALIAFRASFPKVSDFVNVPWYLYIGGALGVIYVTAVLLFVPQLGAANVIMAVFLGQMAASLAIDHFALFGVPQIRLDITRVSGCVMMMGGLYLIQLPVKV